VHTIEWSDFEKVFMVSGTVLRVEEFREARKPAYKIWADYLPLLGDRPTLPRADSGNRYRACHPVEGRRSSKEICSEEICQTGSEK
jgi:hypothetical protein